MAVYTGRIEDPLASGIDLVVRGATFVVAQVSLAKRRELRQVTRDYIAAGQRLAGEPGVPAPDVLAIEERLETLAEKAVELARAGLGVNYPDIDRAWVENNLSRDQVFRAANIALGLVAGDGAGSVPLAPAPNRAQAAPMTTS
jgi:hypothetical protein